MTINKVAATLTCSNELISFDPTDNVNAQKTKTGVGCNGGTITVSGGSSSTFTASYNNYSHTIYITRIGMVARRNSGTNGSGIVLYKQDNSGLYTWANRNGGNPSPVAVYVSDLSSKTNKSWTCGTQEQYQQCGVDDGSPWSTLQSRLSSAGCTQFSSDKYWSDTEGNTGRAYYFSDGTWGKKSKSDDIKVRPLFEF